jgi:hypothetical protein
MFELVIAAGFDIRKLEFMQAHDIEGNIIRDEQLRRETSAAGYPFDRIPVLRSMSEADRAALRARVQS